jgi:hypothetical protein
VVHVGIVLIAIIVAIDNALLAGLLLPSIAYRQQRTAMIAVGLLLGVSQIVVCIGVDRLLNHLVFRMMAIVLLAWMSVRTLTLHRPHLRSVATVSVTAKTWVYTLLGNLDNMIWLGSELKGGRLWLIILSMITIPLFIGVALFLAEQCEKQQWILPLGAGMMAWAAASLAMEMPAVRSVVMISDRVPHGTVQCLMTVTILLAGFGIKRLIAPRE